MVNKWTPMQWPKQWKSPEMLDCLKGSAITHLLMDDAAELKPVVQEATQRGLKIVAPEGKLDGIFITKGFWPGIRISESGGADRASAGPTGIPWVNSNGWRASLAAAMNPGSDIWVAARPTSSRISKDAYVIAFVDAAIYGARWIISLDDALAAGISEKRGGAVDTWGAITSAAAFFAARNAWNDYRPEGVFGILSDFSGENAFLGDEILNRLSRDTQQFQILVKSRFKPAELAGVKALIYADVQPPAPELKKEVTDFVVAGGMLITGEQWGETPGAIPSAIMHSRFAFSELGKGKIALAKTNIEDPWLLGLDVQNILSHRHELLRFWNGGAVSANIRTSPDRKLSVVQMVFYGAANGIGDPTLWIAGKYKSANFLSIEHPSPTHVPMEVQLNGVELHLPAVTQYAAVALES